MKELEVRPLRPGDEAVLERVADGVFDHPIDRAAACAFLADPRHHLAVAVEEGTVVAFASGVHYFHPDKPVPELFINEVGVAGDRRGQGLGKAVLRCLIDVSAALGCREAWVLTESTNAAAKGLYASAGGKKSGSSPVLFSFRTEDG